MKKSQEEIFKVNQNSWDLIVEPHLKSDFYQMEKFLNGWNSLCEISQNALGNIEGQSILHLQCHFGQDSLSMSRMGADVVGVDFSKKAINQAKKLNSEMNLNAAFIESNIYDLPNHLDQTFDTIFTSYGALVWLPDIEKWTSIVDKFLKPGGRVIIVEFHPTLYIFNFNTLTPEYHYFNNKVYLEIEENSYASESLEEKREMYFWNHSLTEVISPLLKKQYQMLEFGEYKESPYNCFPNMKETRTGWYALQSSVTLPHVYHVVFKK